MTTLTEVVEAITRVIAVDDQLNVFPYPPSAPPMPCAFPVPPPINYRETMRRGVIRLQFEIIVMSSPAPGAEGQVDLYPYLDWTGPKSLILALEDDQTLGLGDKVSSAVNAETRPLGLEEIAAYEAFGVAIPFLVVVTNT